MPDPSVIKRPRKGPGWFDLALETREQIIDEILQAVVEPCNSEILQTRALRSFVMVSYKICQEDLQRPMSDILDWLSDTEQKHLEIANDLRDRIRPHCMCRGIWFEEYSTDTVEQWRNEYMCQRGGCEFCHVFGDLVTAYEITFKLEERVERHWTMMKEYVQLFERMRKERERRSKTKTREGRAV